MKEPSASPPAHPILRSALGAALLVAGLAAAILWLRPTTEPGELDYSIAYGLIRDGKVAAVELRGTTLDGQLTTATTIDGAAVTRFRTTLPDHDDAILPLLHQHVATIHVASAERSGLTTIVTALLPWVLIGGVWWWLSRRAQRTMIAGGGALGGFLSRGHRLEPTKATTTFDDVAGLAAAKRDLQEVVAFLKEPERFEKLGGKIPRGILLLGPPGTGKTLLARAIAGEAGVSFFSISGSEFIEMFVGVGAARVRELFASAKRAAPSILFIDEIDAVGRIRGSGLGGGHDEREQTLNQLLSEMDGFDQRDLVVVVAATNRPDVLDPALLRPGRFDRRVVVDLPELAARRAILGVHVRHKPLADDVELDDLAAATPGFSGADLANLVNEAALHATRRAADAITRDDFTAAYDKIVLGDPREGRLTPTERRRVATHEAGHALVAWATPDAQPLRRVSILPRGLSLGATEQTAAEDRHLATRTELEARLAVLLGGYASEARVLGQPSTGSERDLREATGLASQMVAHYGMSDALGPVYYEHQEAHAFLGNRIATGSGPSDATVHAIEREARAVLDHARRQADALVQAHRDALERLIGRLLEEETLERAALTTLLGPRPTATLDPVVAQP
jgi:cell division protease FtsH